MGAPPDEPRGWPITIRTPRSPDEVAATVFLKDSSLSTSGSYEKFFWADGRRYAHIIDPRTGYPAQGTASVSVAGASDDRQRGVGEALLHQRPCVDDGAPADGAAGVLLRGGAAGVVRVDR